MCPGTQQGYPHSARLRQMVNDMETFEQLEEGINRIFTEPVKS